MKNRDSEMKGGRRIEPYFAGIRQFHVFSLVAAVLGLCLIPSSRALAASCDSAPAGLIGWWPGDGSANDIAGTNHGALQGGATASAAGQVNTTFSFDGTNGFVQIPNSAQLRPTNFTIEAWVRFAALDSAGSGGSPAGDQYIVFRQNTRSSDFEGFDLSKTRSGGSDVIRFLISSASAQTVEIRSVTTISTGTWYHVAAVRGSNQVQLYLNGSNERQTNINFPNDYGNFPLYFGTSGQAAWDHKLKGNLDEVSIYDRALSSNEIAAIYLAGSSGKCKAPNIVTQPQSQFVSLGSNATVTAAATGFGTLAYQWRFNGGPIAGATGTALLLTNFQYSAAGNYTVVVTNTLGTVTSSVAVLTVRPPDGVPFIASFAPASAIAGATVTISGTNFSSTASNNIVYFGAVRALVTTASSTSLMVTVPIGATYAPITVGVNGLVGTGNLPFKPTFIGDGSPISASSFAARQDLGGADGPLITAIADLDNDGKPDLVVANVYAHTISLFRNIGNAGALSAASFAARIDLPSIGGTDNPYGFAVGDVDGDGKIDLVFTDRANNRVGIYRNVAVAGTLTTSSFAPAVYFNTGVDPREVRVRDLDGDGRADLVVCNYGDGTVSILRNIGSAGTLDSGSFAPRFDLSSGPAAFDVTVQDLDGDGRPDLAVANMGGTTISIFRNIGSPGSLTTNSFGPRIDLPALANTISVIAGDLDGDGQPDLISGGNSGSISIYRNLAIPGPLQTNSFAAQVDFGNPGWVFNTALGDFNGDGKVDIGVVGQLNSYLSVFQNQSSPGGFTASSLGSRVDFSSGWNASGLSVGDLDGDGRPDIVFCNIYDDTITLYRNVTPFGGPPTIVSQPTNTTVYAGATVVLGASATGAQPLSYTWSFNGTNLANGGRVSGANTSTLTIAPAQSSDAGNYQVVVTNAYGSATSAVAQVRLTYPTVITAWGYNDYGQCNVPGDLTNAIAIAAGGHHSLALRRDGTVAAWGWNGNGQCNVPPGLSNVVAIGGGTYFSAALKADGTVVSWGDLYNGSLAAMPPGLDRAVVLDSGSAENLVLQPDATLAAWGYGGDGRLNIPASASNIIAIAAGHAAHNLALRSDRTIVGWGDPGYGALNIPPGLSNVAQIDLGWGFSVVLKTDGTVSIWGSFTDFGPVYLPPGLTNLQTIAAGYEHILAIQADGTVTAWGHNRIGQATVPPTLANVVAVSGGLFHSLALSRQGPPEMIQQPSNEIVTRDGTVEFISSAVGDHLKYQWKFNGGSLSGGTLARLLLTNVQPAQVGLYSVAVSNASGFVVSSNASLSLIPLLITAHPTNQTIFEAADTIFTVGVNGTGRLSYQWQLNGTAINGQTNQSLILTNVDAAQSGTYSVAVSNSYGSAQSSNALLTVNLPAITNQPLSQLVVGGQQVTFTVGAIGAALAYQWRFNGSPLPGETNTSITLSNVSPDNAGTWSVAVNNSHRTLLSSNADLAVIPIVITQQPVSAAVFVNSNITFTAAASGTTPLFYQWQKDGVNLNDSLRFTGSTSNVLSITSIQTNDAGGYALVVSNAYASLTSQVATLTVRFPPLIIQGPASQTNFVGSNATFTVLADGRPTLSYAWTFNGGGLVDGAHFSGSGTPSLTISNLVLGDSGNYAVAITNADGAITSAAAILTVVQPPTFTVQPAGRLVAPGLPTTFSATAAGTALLTYQWQFNGADIVGATNLSYTIAAVATTNFGLYHLVASNAYGVATSADALLAQGQIAAWGRNSAFNQTVVPLGATNVVAVSAGNNANGESHSLALRADGTVVAWGNNTSGQTNVPSSATNIVAIAAGGTHSLALRADGTVFSWGNTANGLSIIPANVSNVIAIAAGGGHSVALRSDGKVFAWGLNSLGQTSVPTNLNRVIAIAAGNTHTLALRSDGTLAGWGRNTDDRQLSPGPAAIPGGLSGVVAMAGGTVQNVALRTNGTLFAWGTITPALTNIPPTATNVTAVAAGDGFNMALRSDGLVVAWGLSNFSATNVPASVSNAIAVAAGSGHALALLGDGRPLITRQPVGGTTFIARDFAFTSIATGTAPLSYRWQSNGVDLADATNSMLTLSNVTLASAGTYQLMVSNALGTTMSVPVPLTVLDRPNLALLSQLPVLQTNYQGARIILNASVIGNGPVNYQWKFNGANLPAGTNEDLIFDPMLMSNAGNYAVTVSNLVNTVSSITSSQRVVLVKAWGYLSNEPPVTLTNAIALAVGYSGEGNSGGHYLALRSDGKIVPWGSNEYFQTNLPPSVTNSFITAIAAGFGDSLALRSDGTVAAWGYPFYGVTNVPVSATNIVAIACGDYHDLGLRSDGSVVAWGQGTSGQTNIPASVSNVVAISGGGQHSLALRANGTVVGWGLNGNGQTTIPISATNVIAVSAGNTHSLALRADGTVLQWGSLSLTQPPAGLSNIVAIAAGYFHCTALRNDGTVVTWGAYYIQNSASIPPDVANVVQIAARGDRDLGMFGTRAPAATIQPFDRTLFRGSNTMFAAKFSGVQPVTYQWQSNGTNVPGATNDTLTLTNLQFAQSGAYQLIASNSYGLGVSRVAKLSVTLPLPEALDTTNVTWTTAGAAPWFGQPVTSHDGVDASRSGSIGNSQDSVLQTILAGPAQFSFWWKVSSEASFDVLDFKLDGVSQATISGEVDWQQQSYAIGSGSHTLQWRYSKDTSGGAGQDTGWVDQFVYAPNPPVISVQPVDQTTNAGATVQFRVTASGFTPLTYQWRQNQSNNVGANSSVLTLNSVTRSNNGLYSVFISNAGGNTISSNALLKVIVPQKFSNGALVANGSVLFFSSDADGGLLTSNDLSGFTAQASSNLVDWITLPGSLSITNGLLLLQDPNQASYSSRFYRIIEQ